MVRNYIKIAFRNLRKHKVFSIINILGLSVGITCCVLIGLYINEELSYDKFHEKSDRIFRVTRQFKASDGTQALHLSRVAPPFASYLKEDFGQIETITRFVNFGGMVRYEDKIFNEPDFLWADPEIADILTFEIVDGDIKSALQQPNSIVISESFGEKYFGKENPVGKTINYNNEVNLLVRGVFKDFPENSSFNFDLLADMNYVIAGLGGKAAVMRMWYRNIFSTLFTLRSSADLETVRAGLDSFLIKHLGEEATNWTGLQIQKMTDIHLKSNLGDEQGLNVDITYVYIFSAIAILILAIACINYMNLATAKSANRAKEVGMRKVFGAGRKQLIDQFLVESVVLVFISVFIAFGTALLILPFFRSFSGLELDLAVLLHWQTISTIVAFSLFVGILAGSYPALYLTKFKVLSVLKGRISSGVRNGALRKILVIVQFTVSLILVVSTVVVFQQLDFIQNKSLGYEKSQMMILSSNEEIERDYVAFKNQLLKIGGVKSIGSSVFIPSDQLLNSRGTAEMVIDGELKSTGVGLKDLSVDHDFVDTYQMEILAGRNFSREFVSDSSNFILNETAILKMGWANATEAIGKRMKYGSDNGQIIGVLKDFHFESLQSEIEPVILTLNGGVARNLSIKMEGGDLKQTITRVTELYENFSPSFPISYNFLDQRFNNLYRTENQRSELFIIFSGLAIFLACLGLFGLASYTVSLRSKEISIRKVLGASVKQIVSILSKEFIVLIATAIILAVPLAWVFMGDWLEGYAYRIDLSWTPFLIAGTLVTLIALVTISTQTLKAATANPSDRLRNE